MAPRTRARARFQAYQTFQVLDIVSEWTLEQARAAYRRSDALYNAFATEANRLAAALAALQTRAIQVQRSTWMTERWTHAQSMLMHNFQNNRLRVELRPQLNSSERDAARAVRRANVVNRVYDLARRS